jgi:pimeloyl-ACP methyl ester carboxylesterase
MAKLRGGYRIIAPDLTGYGRSARWPANRPFDGTEDFELIARLARPTREPVHLVGHSYGATAVMGAAAMLGPLVRSATLIEPVAFQLLRQPGYEKEWAVIHRLTRDVERHMAAGRRRRAAAAYMGFWIGRLRWWFTPRKIKRSIHETMDKAAAEFGLIEKVRLGLEDLRNLTAPVRLIYGEQTTAPAKAVVRIMAGHLPECDVRMVKGAGHMSPFTHPDEINGLVTQHLASH